jgi:hypothetical protein
MSKTVPIIGVEIPELRWIRMLITLLRHPDPGVPELARQALIYLTDSANKRSSRQTDPNSLDHAG